VVRDEVIMWQSLASASRQPQQRNEAHGFELLLPRAGFGTGCHDQVLVLRVAGGIGNDKLAPMLKLRPSDANLVAAVTTIRRQIDIGECGSACLIRTLVIRS
jgi:hypothetical protein